MKRLQITLAAITLVFTLSTASYAGTIIGSRTNKVGTIIGSRTGTIIGSKTGTIIGSKTGSAEGEEQSKPMSDQLLSKLAMLMMSLAW